MSSWQLHTLGHTCSGSCICTLAAYSDLHVHPECTLTGHSKTVVAIAFSADGKRVVSGSRDKLVKIWDADKGSEVQPWGVH